MCHLTPVAFASGAVPCASLRPVSSASGSARLCLSMSDFHPDQWNPAWSVESILKGLVSFMIEGTSTAGSITTTAADKHKFAKSSGDYNLKDADFCEMFPEMVDRINAEGAERQKNSASAVDSPCSGCPGRRSRGGTTKHRQPLRRPGVEPGFDGRGCGLWVPSIVDPSRTRPLTRAGGCAIAPSLGRETRLLVATRGGSCHLCYIVQGGNSKGTSALDDVFLRNWLVVLALFRVRFQVQVPPHRRPASSPHSPHRNRHCNAVYQ